MNSYLEELNKSFNSFCSCVVEAIKKTEKDLDRELSEDEKKLMLAFAFMRLYEKYSPNKREYHFDD